MGNSLNSTTLSQVRIKNLDVKIYDVPTLFYISIWIFLILTFRDRIPNAPQFLMCHFVLLMAIILWIVKPPQLKIIQFFRHYYEVAYLFIFFGFLNHFIPAINLRTIDHELIQIDHWLFGQHPTVWFQSITHPIFTEILLWSYLGYYFLPLSVPIGLHLAKKSYRIDEYLTIVLTAFYLFYFGNFIFPAYGPRFYLAHLHTQPLQGIWLAEGIQHVLNNLERIQLDAFPSGHACVIFILMYYTFKHVRKLFWGILPICLALLISTIYLRLHYVVDVIAGLFLTIFVFWFVHFFLERLTPKSTEV